MAISYTQIIYIALLVVALLHPHLAIAGTEHPNKRVQRHDMNNYTNKQQHDQHNNTAIDTQTTDRKTNTHYHNNDGDNDASRSNVLRNTQVSTAKPRVQHPRGAQRSGAQRTIKAQRLAIRTQRPRPGSQRPSALAQSQTARQESKSIWAQRQKNESDHREGTKPHEHTTPN